MIRNKHIKHCGTSKLSSWFVAFLFICLFVCLSLCPSVSLCLILSFNKNRETDVQTGKQTNKQKSKRLTNRQVNKQTNRHQTDGVTKTRGCYVNLQKYSVDSNTTVHSVTLQLQQDVLVVVEESTVPQTVCSSCSSVKIARVGAIEVIQAVEHILRCMTVNDVDQHVESIFMTLIHKILKIIRSAITTIEQRE